MRTAIMLVAAAALPLGACSTYPSDTNLATVGTGAAIGAAGGAGVAALTGGSLLAGAAIGGVVGGLAGAVWADRNNDGVADGYVYNGNYYEGAPAGYSNSAYAAPAAPRCGPSVGRSAAIGAAGGAALGAGVSAIAGTGLLASALVGGAVGGLAGAVWADSNNDGCVDGYVRDGRYYAGEPVVQPVSAPRYTGERG